MSNLFEFPDPVNETSTHLVAFGVVAQAVVFLVFREGWLLVPLAYGFLVAASLESVFALCLACIAYRLIWECEDCDDISDRLRTALASSAPATN